MAETDERVEIRERFIGNLERLAEIDRQTNRGDSRNRAALAQLKRCVGRKLEDCPDIYSVFYRSLTASLDPEKERIYFLVATLFPLAPERGSGNLGDSLRRSLPPQEGKGADESEGSKAIDRRMIALLDCDIEQLPFRLRQIVRLLASKEIKIDWRSLLKDLLLWTHPDRIVQKKWAKSYFGGFRSMTSVEESTQENAILEAPASDESE